MENQNSEKNINKTPSKMARLAWPKSKYGVIIAIIIIIVVNLIYYKNNFPICGVIKKKILRCSCYKSLIVLKVVILTIRKNILKKFVKINYLGLFIEN